MRSIRKQFLIIEYLFLIAIIGIPALLYVVGSKPYCLMKNENMVEQVYQYILKMDLYDITEEDYKYLKSAQDKGMQIAIAYNDGEIMQIVYGSSVGSKHKYSERHYRKMINKSINEFRTNADATINEKSVVKLKGKTEQDGVVYYILIKQPLGLILTTLNSSVMYFSFVIIIAFAVSGIMITIFSGRIIRPIREMERVANKISRLEFGEQVTVNSRMEEIDSLGTSINSLSERIQKYLTDLENYNYCLREENFSINQLEGQRDSCVNSISHELKTPLAIVSSQLDLIEEMPVEADKTYLFNSIHEEIEKMSKLISMLLNNSFELYHDTQLLPVDLSGMINELVQKYEYLFDQNGIFYEHQLEDYCFILGDTKYLEMAFHNYLINAIEHCKRNGIIRISLEKKENTIIVSVFNQGSTIKEEELDLIWNQYFREKKKSYSSVGNNGIGLSIVKSVINIHQGRCFVRNCEDGVTFYMEFNEYKEM